MTFFVDTNILLRLKDTDSPHCPIAKRVVGEIISRGDVLVASAQIMIEFWAVATRPKNLNGLGLTPQEAEASLRDAETMVTFLPEPGDVAKRWRALANLHAICGKQAHDTRLVALMEAHNLTDLLTFNVADFARFTQITCWSPSSFPPFPEIKAGE